MKKTMDKTLVLAGDVGGTKTNLGLFFKEEERLVPKVIETFSSANAPDFEHITQTFFENHPESVTRACFGVAGPVIDGVSKITNLPWNVSEDRIKKQFRFDHVRIVNDVTATASAIPLLNKDELFSLNQVASVKEHHIALIAPGTGLGIAVLMYQDGRYMPISSEGGHADFAPNSESEAELWGYLHKRYGHVSIERVVSGSGLVNIYMWLKDSGRITEPEWFSQNLKENDAAKAIADGALAEKDPGCVKALNMFVSIFGSVAGNLALTNMTLGGVYLGGGIPPKILSKLKENIFIKAFSNKGRFRGFLEQIPVKIILNDKAALIGAAYFASQLK